MYRGRGPCERARNTDSRFLPETSEVGPADLPRLHITAISPKRTSPDERAVLWYRVLSDGMTLACGLIWVGYQKRMSCTTVLTALTSSPIVPTSAVHATRLNTLQHHSVRFTVSRRRASAPLRILNVTAVCKGRRALQSKRRSERAYPVVAKDSSVRQISLPRGDAQRRPRVWAGKGFSPCVD